MNRTLASALGLCLLVTAAVAQADELPKDVQEMKCLVGNWKMTGTMTAEDQQAPVRGSWKCRSTRNQFGVACEGALTGVPGMPQYLETDLFGYDPGAGKYHWFSVTNAGETHDHVSTKVSGNRVQFRCDGVQQGKPMKELITLTFAQGGKALHLRSETFVDGKSAGVLDGGGKK